MIQQAPVGQGLVIAIAFLLAGCGNPTADKPAAEVREAVVIEAPAESAAAESSADSANAAVEYTMTENSGLDFEGYKLTGPHVGGFGKFEGTVAKRGKS